MVLLAGYVLLVKLRPESRFIRLLDRELADFPPRRRYACLKDKARKNP